jgi:hypothetical protein
VMIATDTSDRFAECVDTTRNARRETADPG